MKAALRKLPGALAVLLFWTALWALLARLIGQELLLPSPLQVLKKLVSLAGTEAFWRATGRSILRVLAGLLAATVLGVLLAALTERSVLARRLLSPVMTLVKSTPVASFIILALLWLGRDILPAFISALMGSDFYAGNAPVAMAFDWGFDGDEYPSAKVRFAMFGIYAQDEWSVNDKLKLTAGIRFDNISFNNDDIMTNNATKAINYGGRHVDTGLWPKSNIQISPRIGFSYDVFGDRSLKIRGGSGLFAGRIPLVFFTNMPTNAGIVKGRLTQMKDAAVLSKFVQGGKLVTDRWKILEILNGIDADEYPTTITPETAPAPSEVAGVDNNFKMPQVWKSSIAFDWTLPVSFPVTITGEYIYTKTLNAVMLTNYNITDDNSGWATFNGADQRHIYPSNYKYNRTDAYILTNSNEGYGSIATIELKAEPVKGLDFIASYTHTVSKEITGMPGSNATAAWKSSVK